MVGGAPEPKPDALSSPDLKLLFKVVREIQSLEWLTQKSIVLQESRYFDFDEILFLSGGLT